MISKGKNYPQNKQNKKGRKIEKRKEKKQMKQRQAADLAVPKQSAPSKKSKKLQPVEAEHSGEHDLNYNNQESNVENVDVSFVIVEIREEYYHSLKTILEKWAIITRVMSSHWAEAIIANRAAGNIADAEEEQSQQEEEEEEQEDDQQNTAYGVLNILPLSNFNNISQKIGQKIATSYESTKKNHPSAINHLNKKTKVSEILRNNSGLFLLINERAVNLPAVVVVNMHRVLAGELKGNPSFNKGYLLAISEIEIPKTDRQKKTNKDVYDPEQLIYSKFEDFALLGHSEMWWVGEQSHNPLLPKVQIRRLYYIIRLDKYFQCAQNSLQMLLQ